MTLDDSGTTLADRVPDAAPITLGNNTVLGYVGNSANSTETLGPVTLAASSTATIQSATTVHRDRAAVQRQPDAQPWRRFVNFVGGVNTDVGTAANQINFTPGIGDNVELPYAKVVGGSGAHRALHTTALGIPGRAEHDAGDGVQDKPCGGHGCRPTSSV